MDWAAAVAELKRRQQAGSSLGAPGGAPGLAAAADPIRAPKPPAEMFDRPLREPFARRTPAPSLPDHLQAIVDGHQPKPPPAAPMDGAAAVAELKRRQAERFAARFGEAGEPPPLDQLPASIALTQSPDWAARFDKDPAGLAAVETWMRTAAGEIGPQLRGSLDTDAVLQLAYQEMMGEALSPEEAAVLARGIAVPEAETFVGASANLLGGTLPTLGAGVKGALAGASLGAAVGAALTPEFFGAGAGPGAAIGGTIGGYSGMAVHSYRSLVADAWLEFGQFVDVDGNRLDPAVRKGAAALAGLLGAGLETTGLGALLTKFPGLRALTAAGQRELIKRLLTRPGVGKALATAAKGWAGGVLTETGTEIGQELVTITAGELAKLADSGEFAALSGDQILERLGDTAWQTARGMSLLAVPGPAASMAVDLRRAAKAQREAKAYEALGEVAGKAKARTEAPGEFQAWVGAVREQVGGPVQDVYVDGEAFKTFFQEAGADPEAVAAELGVVEQYRSYADNGGVIAVPLEIWTAKVAATPAHAGLADHARLSLDAMTPAEARRHAEDIEEMAKEAGAEPAGAEAPARILDDVARQLEAAGRAPDIARLEAAVLAAFFTTMGERSGTDPWLLYQGQRLEVRRVLPDGLEGMDDAELDAILGRNPAGSESEAGPASQTSAESAAPPAPPGLQADSKAAAPAGTPSRSRDGDSVDTTGDRAFLPDGQAVEQAGAGAPGRGPRPSRRELVETLQELGLDPATATAADIAEASRQTAPAAGEAGGKTLFQGGPVLGEGSARYVVLPEGEFVALAGGSADLGAITPDIAAAIGREAGPIRLAKGEHDAATGKGYGETHIEARHGSEVREAGATDAAAFVATTASTFDEIRQGNRSALLLIRRGRRNMALVTELQPAADGSGYWSVASALVLRSDYLAKRRLLWERGRSPSLGRADATTPLSRSGQSSSDVGTTDGDGQPETDDGNTGGRTFQQSGQDPRGSITFTPDGRTLLRLFSGANLSTVLHEAGHLFLEVYGQLDAKADTPAHVRADYQKIRDWLGVIDTQDIATEHHEKFARGFEAYLMEGRAPSIELQRPFARFRAWLVLIYRTLKGLDVELTDDVRRVFDRMLATDDAIRAAESAGRFAPLLAKGDKHGMTPAEHRAYLEQAERATMEATRQLERDAMEALERERSAEWAAALERHRLEAAEELDQRPAYRALAFFGGGLLNGQEAPPSLLGLKLNRDWIKADFGEEAVAALDAKREQHGRILKKDGVHPDDVAPVLGFGSGAEMVAAMVAAPSREAVIQAEAERRAKAELGDILEPSSLAEAAAAAVHNDERAVFLMTELKALTAKVGAVSMPLQVIKAAAERAVMAETVRQVTAPDRHLYTSQKWAREAQRHVAKGDYRAAAEAKRKQLFHFEAWKIARRHAKSVESTLKRWDLISRGRVKNLPAEHRDQILGFIEQVDFRKASKAEVERRTALAEWIKAQEELGQPVDIDPRLLARSRQRHYSALSVEEFMGYRDTVRHLEHLGVQSGKLLEAGAKADYEATVQGIVDSIETNATKLEAPKPDFGPKKGDKKTWRRFMASHRKMEFIFSSLDGGKLGPVWKALFKVLADAQGREADLNERLSAGLREIFGRYDRAERRAMGRKAVHVAELGQTFTKRSLLSLALNWGNDGNRAAVLEGYKWQAKDVQAALDAHLDERDWQVVQDIWRLVDSLWPEIEALQKDLTGSAPPKVEPVKVKTRFGEIDGGYYPLMYDPDLSHKAFIREEAQATQELFGGNWTKPATRKGHTIARQGSGGQPVLLDLGVLPKHLAQVAKDLTHRRAVIDVARLTADPRVREAIIAAAGRETYQLIRPWLQSIAAPAYDPGTGLEAFFARARVGVTVANMGLKITTALVQPLGYLTTLAHLGPRWSLVGLGQVYAGNPLAARDFAFERSAELRHRQKAFDRDVKDTIRRLTGESGIEGWRAAFFWHIGALDMAVALPTWHGAYQKALHDNPADEAGAIAAADAAVRMTQSAGGAKDLASIQRGTEFQRLFTAFYSYFSVLFNQFERSVRGTDFANPGDYPRFIGQMTALWLAPAILGELIAGRGPDDDEAWQLWAAKTLAAYPVQSVVFARDIVNGALGGYGYTLAPAGDAIGSGVRLALDIGEGDYGRPAIANAVMAASYYYGFPGRQMIITGEAFIDWLNGDFEPESFGEALRFGFLQRRPADER